MSFADANPGYEIKSEDQAKNWVIEQVEACKAARADCNVQIPGNDEATVEFQKKAYTKFLIKHGAALGSLMGLHRCKKISDVAYNELRQQVLNTLAPSIVGGVNQNIVVAR